VGERFAHHTQTFFNLSELIRSEMAGVTLGAFEPDRRKRWLVERGIEIISEAQPPPPQRLKGPAS
jgi:hypothetical protein